MAALENDPGPTTDVYNPPPGANAADDQPSTALPREPVKMGSLEIHGNPAPLFAAFAKAQEDFETPKKTKTVKVQKTAGGSYEFDYAPLDEVLAACRPALNEHDLSVLQVLTNDGPVKTLQTILAHGSGAYMRTNVVLGHSDDVKGLGSEITYLRRYTLQALLGVAAEDDDDGNAASGDKITAVAERPGTIQRRSVQELTKKARELGIDVTDLTPLGPKSTPADASKLIETLATRIKEHQNGFQTADGKPAEKSATVSAKNGSAPRRGTPTKTA